MENMSLTTGWILGPWLTGPGTNLEPLRVVSWNSLPLLTRGDPELGEIDREPSGEV